MNKFTSAIKNFLEWGLFARCLVVGHVTIFGGLGLGLLLSALIHDYTWLPLLVGFGMFACFGLGFMAMFIVFPIVREDLSS